MTCMALTELALAMSNTIIALKDEESAQAARRFFKTGEGEYGENDCFLGVRVPVLRQLVKQFKQAELNDIESLLPSQYHELRLFALFMMVALFERSKKSPNVQQQIVNSYLAHTQYINNWDLVDSSAYKILGPYLLERDKSVLVEFAHSNSLWERRIAMITCYCFIKQHQFKASLQIAELLLKDSEDLIHKAVGWMLREIANRDKKTAEDFLLKHYQEMPRTMLRYAIEKFSKEERSAYLSGNV